MQPATLPLDIYRGDSWRMRVTLLDQNQQPIDLTNVIAKSEIRDRPAGTTVVPITCTITLPNIIDLFLAGQDSQKLPPNAVWDLQLSYGSGDVATPLAGQVTVTADVTDSTPTPTLTGPIGSIGPGG
jgi:hypothetical protein